MPGSLAGFAGFVDGIAGYDLALPPDSLHNGLPSTSATLIVNLGGPMLVRWPGGRTERLQVMIAGLHVSPAQVITEGRQHGIQLAVTPAGIRALLGVPIAALAQTFADPLDVIGRASQGRREAWLRLAESVAARTTWPERYAELGRLLRLTVRDDAGDHRADPMATAWQRVQSDRGRIAVAQLASDIGYSRRHLSQRFRAEFGVTPKQVCRLARFEHARALAVGAGLAHAAAAAGYSDQAHLTREWTAFAGRTPRQTLDAPFYRSDDLPFRQDGLRADGPASPS